MLRRRLFLYSIMFTAGIASGYLMFENHNYLMSPIIILAISVAIYRIKYNSIGQLKEKRKLITFMMLGLLIFTGRYIEYNPSVYSNNVKIDPFSQGEVEGIILNVTTQDDKTILIVKETLLSGIGRIRVSYHGEFEEYLPSKIIGRKVKCYGELHEPTGPDNPNCFNYRTYLRSKGIKYIFSAKHISISEKEIGRFWKYKRKILETREKYLDNFDTNSEAKGFIKGVLFGDKTDINEEILEEFSLNSTGHILAVSGLHISFIYGLLRMITGRRKSILVTIFVIAILIIYGEMTLWSASTVRAVIVLVSGMLSIYVRRPFDLLSSVSASAIIILVYNPYQLFATGFQLSFIALLGISFFTKPISFFVGDTVSVPVAVQIAVAPLTAFTFNRFNPLSIFINIPIIFISSFLVPICMIGLAFESLFKKVPKFIIEAILAISEMLIEINKKLTFGGEFSIEIGGISMGLLISLYVLTFIISSEWMRIMILRDKKREILMVISYLIIPLISVNIALFDVFAGDEIVFVSVGQGDCVHIDTGKTNILIDGGGNRFYNVGKNILKPYLLKAGVTNLDMVLITHLHTDHYKGAFELSEIFPIKRVMVPDSYMKAIEVARTQELINEDLFEKTTFIKYGDKVNISEDIYIEPIWPVSSKLSSISIDDPNENNMIYIIYFGDIKIMVTGDMLERDELDMIEYYRNTDKLKCDVLKIAHHGSNTSSCDEFIDEVNPAIAVIQVGLNNAYGHPSKEIIEKLQDRKIQIYRNDINGAIGLNIVRNRIIVDKMR